MSARISTFLTRTSPTVAGSERSIERDRQSSKRPEPTSHMAIASRPTGQLVGAVLAAAAIVWLVFHLAGLHAPFGMVVCWLLVFVLLYGTITWRTEGVLVAKDRLGTVFVCTGAVIAFLPLAAIIAFVVARGWPVVATNFPHFITTDLKGVGSADPYTRAGMKAAIMGTLEQVGLATAMTTPFAIMTALYLTESLSRLARGISTVVDAMSGVPAIIAGLFVYLVWVLPRESHHRTGGYSGWAASMALAIVMIPTVTRTAEEVLRTIPGSLREAALALGAPRWRATMQVVLPTARSGLITAVVLGVARAVGETAPVLFTAHGSTGTNLNPFHGPQTDLSLQVYQFITSTSNNQVSEAFGGALVLLVLVLILFLLARIVGSGRRRGRRSMVAWARREA